MATNMTYIYIPPIFPGFLPVLQSGHIFIPCDLGNADYQVFLAWLGEGNPAPEGWTGPTNASG